jgi:hypothetical protein
MWWTMAAEGVPNRAFTSPIRYVLGFIGREGWCGIQGGPGDENTGLYTGIQGKIHIRQLKETKSAR